MKRLTPLFLLVLLVSLVIPARADLIWTPDNLFYEKHAEECEYVGRQQYANGTEGFITLWSSPSRTTVTGQCENGVKLWLYYIYKDWGYVHGTVEGWVPLSQLAQVYDGTSFAQEFGNSFTQYNGEFTGFSDDVTKLVCFTYPGAEDSCAEFDLSKAPNLSDDLREYAIQQIFVDENGLTWGYINYLYGSRQLWFCLDRPDGAGIPVRTVTTPQLIEAATPVLPAAALLPWFLVGGAVILTAAILVVLARRKRTAERG